VEPVTEPQTAAQALLWPQLLYALAQVAGAGDPPKGSIWVTAPDIDHLKLIATDGVAMLIAKLPATHTLRDGAYRIQASAHTKKPALRECNAPALVSLDYWGESLPFNPDKASTRLQGQPTQALLDPERAARFFKAAAAIGRRVELTSLKEAVFFRCQHLEMDADVRGLIANLEIKR
jgi:hypothetical protein